MSHPLLILFKRDCSLFLRRRQDAIAIIGFFLVAVALFPLGISPEPQILRTIAPGAVWIAALFAIVLALERLFTDDLADGTLEQQLLSAQPQSMVVLVRLAAHWLVTGLPLVLLSPLIGLQFGLHGAETGVLTLSLILGTPVLVLIGGIGAALTAGLRGSGGLVTLLLLPLYVPVLVLGTAAVSATMTQSSPEAHLSLLGAALLVALVLAPWATAAALRITID
ncbi:MAG: heme exporter protein CcmB [Gammaproteobacteria bacterium]